MAYVNQNYQTIDQFMKNPFMQNNVPKYMKYMHRYTEYKLSHEIQFSSYAIIEDAYYIHLKVQSESNKSTQLFYDVVVRFFTPSPKTKSETNLRGYYIQFFSNSPGFMYNYAVVYRVHGYLIDFLYEKMDPNYKNILPTKTNSQWDLSYDSSIFYACAFLSDNRFMYLDKGSLKRFKKKDPDDLFNDIQNFQDMKLKQDAINLEKKYEKAVENNDIDAKTKISQDQYSLTRNKKVDDVKEKRHNKIEASNATSMLRNKTLLKKGKKSTSSKPLITRVAKKLSGKTTRKR